MDVRDRRLRADRPKVLLQQQQHPQNKNQNKMKRTMKNMVMKKYMDMKYNPQNS